MKNKKGYVYLLCDTLNEGLYKIGVTTGNIEKRIKKLQTGNPGEIYMCSYYETDIPFFIEKHLHMRLFGNRVNGEWFSLSNEEALKFREYCKDVEDMCDIMKDNYFFKKLKLK